VATRLTAIVATVGPASADETTLGRLVEAGMDVARLNFAHGDYETHGRTIRTLRRVAEDRGRFVAVLQDLAGPKIRLRTPGGKAVPVERGGRVRLGADLGPPAADLATTYPGLVADAAVERIARERKLVDGGDRILIISGQFPGRPGGTDTLRVHTVAGPKGKDAS
jgi:pyruvate kinase